MDQLILKGLGHGEKYEDNSLDVYQFFNASCYCGFGDDDKVWLIYVLCRTMICLSRQVLTIHVQMSLI